MSRKSILFAGVAILTFVASGYFLGNLVPMDTSAATSPGTCLPIEKGGTGCDTAETIKYLNIYPVGSIYISTTSTNPGEYLGGTWESYGDGRTLVGVGSNGTTNYTAQGQTGGADNVKLTVAQMPSHTHVQNSHNHTQNSHYHTTHNNANRWFLFSWDSSGGAAGVSLQTMGSGGHQSKYFASNAINTGTATATNVAATATNQNTGGGGAHENRMPYITTYFWKRVS